MKWNEEETAQLELEDIETERLKLKYSKTETGKLEHSETEKKPDLFRENKNEEETDLA